MNRRSLFKRALALVAAPKLVEHVLVAGPVAAVEALVDGPPGEWVWATRRDHPYLEEAQTITINRNVYRAQLHP